MTAVRRKRHPIARVMAGVGLAVVAVVAVSTVTNLMLGSFERGSVARYGEAIAVDGGAVNVSVTGESGQVLVLLSGYGTASPVLDFAPLVDELDDAHTVVVVERFGYGYSDLDVTDRTVENISTELHDTLATLEVHDSYVLVAHSLAGIYALDYVNRFPGEVSALVTIDGTVPEDFAVAAPRSRWEAALSVTGWVRWVTALNPALTAPAAPAGVYSREQIEQMRLMTIWNYANRAIVDENNRNAENFAAMRDLTYPSELPVLVFLSRQLTEANPDWFTVHEQQLHAVQRSEIVVLDGGHYLHWTHSPEIAASTAQFLQQSTADR